MTATESKLVTKLNVVEMHVREWQRGAINLREMQARCGEVLTRGEIDLLTTRLHRTYDRPQTAKVIADVIGL